MVLALSHAESGAQTPTVTARGLEILTPFGFSPAETLADPLPTDSWANTGPEAAKAALLAADIRAASPAARALLRRALASPGQGPQSADATLGAERLAALLRIGRVNDAQKGLNALRSVRSTMQGLQTTSEIAVLAQDFVSACNIMRAEGFASGSDYGQKLRALCAAITKDMPALNLALAELRKNKILETWYASALARAANPTPAGAPLPARLDDTLYAGLAQYLDLPRGGTSIAQANNAVLIRLVDAPETPAIVRAAAIEQAARAGLRPGRDLRRAALALPGFGTDANLMKNRELLNGLARVQAAAPDNRTTEIANVLRATKSYPEFHTLANLLADDVEAAKLDAAKAALGPILARGALAIGNFSKAREFADIARETNGISADDPAYQRLRLAISIGEDNADSWLSASQSRLKSANSLGNLQAGIAAREVILARAARGGSNAYISETDLAAAKSGSRVPSALLATILDAAARQARSETALAIARMFRPETLFGLDVGDASAAFGALHAVGLHDDAKALGVELLIVDLSF